jgi:hypothetical protein
VRRSRALPLLIGIGSLALAASGCSFLLGDPYGDYLQKAERWVDLRTELEKKAGLTLNDLSGIAVGQGSRAGSHYSYVFLQANFADYTSRIGALGYEGLDLLDFQAFPNMGPLMADADAMGDIRIGNQAYFADSLLPSVPTPAAGHWLVTDSPPGSNFLLFTDGMSLLHKDEYTAAWSPVGPPPPWPISSTPESWNLVRATVLKDGRICLLFFLGGAGWQGTVRCAAFANYASFAAAFALASPSLFDSPAANLSASISLSSSGGSWDGPSGVGAWITEAGVVALTSNNNNRYTLTRYPLGPGAALDSYSMTASYDDLLYFEASGKYWYRFDRSSGRLFRLRTWWT